ncbi:DMT family transporter [Halodesulfovibrio aestuarii]|uniref:DMT family transporter n=1 Tax=Halodesulfovibrio aestuarii TaxID=126333 RepID=UPI003D34565F
MPSSNTSSALLSVFAGAICISFSAIFAKLASTSPDVSAFYRTFIGGSCLLILSLFQCREAIFILLKKHFGMLCLGGVLLTLDLTAWHRSINILGPGVGTILVNFQVFFLAVAGWIFFKERITVRFALAVPLALAGLCMLIGITLDNLLTSKFSGIGLGLAAALWLAFYTLIVRHIQVRSPKISPIAVVALVSLASAASMGIFFIWNSTSIVIPTATDGIWLFLYGLVSQATGWLLISRGLPNISTSQAGLTILIMPTLSFIWDILFFARPAGIMELAGGILALTAIWLGTSSQAGAKE